MATTTTTRPPEGPDHLEGSRRRHPAGRLRRAQANTPALAILGLVATLVLFGLVMVISASSVTDLKDHGTTWFSFKRQALWAAVGTFGLVMAYRLHYRRWRQWVGPMLIGTVVLLVLVLVPGVGTEVNGSSRWLGVGALRIQPSEFAKLAVLLFIAKLLADREREGKAHVVALTLKPALIVFGGVAALLMLQPNLGTTIVLGAIVLTVLYVAGQRLHHLGGIAIVGGLVAGFLAFGASYRRARMTAFLNPWADPGDTGYQTIQSLVGIASGGLKGVGLGASRAKYEFLPEAHTDFIFAIVAEELGMIGALAVIALFAVLLWRGLRAGWRAPDPFGRFLGWGFVAVLVLQALVNISVAIALFPTKGIPLPFLSYGGSSMVVSLTACGALLNVSQHGG